MRASLTDHLSDFFNAYFECFQFVDVIVQQKPNQQEEIFAYLCHAPVPPEVIIALAYEAKEQFILTPITEEKTGSPSLPEDQKEAVTYLQSLTPREKYQLFIKGNTLSLLKITWARLEKDNCQPVGPTDKKELESALEKRNLHLIHGHTSGEVTGATNLDTSWGKGNRTAGHYLASVHHTGGEQLTKIEQTLFKYTADLSQHPSLEKNTGDNKDIDAKHLGIVPMQPNDTLELGDMHANALRLIYHLIKHGVFQVNETDYGTMVRLYNEIFDLFNTNETLSDHQKSEIIQKHNAFKTLIDNIAIKEQPIKLKLIGDLLADRGASDILMEWLIIKLHNAENITLSILASNHDQAYFIEPDPRNDSIPPFHGQRRSLDNAVKIREKDPANAIKEHKFPEASNSTNDSLKSVQLITLAKTQENDFPKSKSTTHDPAVQLITLVKTQENDFPKSKSTTHDPAAQLIITPLGKILRSPFTWALLSASAAVYPAYDCIQADNKLDSLLTVLDHLTHHGTLTLVLSAAATTCLLITAGATLYSLCAKNSSDSATSTKAESGVLGGARSF
jgi:hypothetical protein